MATGKLSLRQKMINMMYLVLLAIMALNVSAEVLKAFYSMEVSLKKTGENIDAKNNFVLQNFSLLMRNQPEKTKEWNDKAQQGKAITADFVKYVDELKKELEEINGGRDEDEEGNPTEMLSADNTEKHANLLLNKGKADDLKQRINLTRDKLIALVPKDERSKIKTDMYTLDEGNKAWKNHTFEGVPVAAVMATLTKMQNDCKNTYADVLNVLYSKVADAPPIDKLVAKIIPKSQNVMVGEKFEADIMLSAYDTKQAAEIVIDGQSYDHQSGTFQFSELPNSQGEHTVEGKIRVKEQDGIKEYPFSTTYNVFNGASTVSADNMNIMYVGLENPVSISISGVPTDRIVASITNGTLQKVGNNKYIARVNRKGEVYITVSERKDDGTVKIHSRYPFRAKNIPAPNPKVGLLQPGMVSKGSLLAQRALSSYPAYDIGFAGVKYEVLSYKCLINVRGRVEGPYTVNGGIISGNIKDLLKQAKKGDMVAFYDIKVKGPTGVDETLYSAGYTIK